MKEIDMSLPRFGYTVIRRKTEIDRDRAASYLKGNRQRKITKAILGEQAVTVEQTLIRCPRCGKETPAYPEFLDLRSEEAFRCRTSKEIKEWSDRQIRLFEKKPPELLFREPVLPIKRFLCPVCRMGSKESTGELFRVRIRSARKKICVSCSLDLENLFAIPWVSSLQMKGGELFESVTFHLRNRHIVLTVTDESGVLYATRDITNIPIPEFADDPVIRAFRLYKPVSRTVKKFFTEQSGGKLPYFAQEWNLANCILLTKIFGCL